MKKDVEESIASKNAVIKGQAEQIQQLLDENEQLSREYDMALAEISEKEDTIQNKETSLFAATEKMIVIKPTAEFAYSLTAQVRFMTSYCYGVVLHVGVLHYVHFIERAFGVQELNTNMSSINDTFKDALAIYTSELQQRQVRLIRGEEQMEAQGVQHVVGCLICKQVTTPANRIARCCGAAICTPCLNQHGLNNRCVLCGTVTTYTKLMDSFFVIAPPNNV